MTALTASQQARLATLEAIVERGLDTFVQVGLALAEIRDARLYKQRYGTFEAYCSERWGSPVPVGIGSSARPSWPHCRPRATFRTSGRRAQCSNRAPRAISTRDFSHSPSAWIRTRRCPLPWKPCGVTPGAGRRHWRRRLKQPRRRRKRSPFSSDITTRSPRRVESRRRRAFRHGAGGDGRGSGVGICRVRGDCSRCYRTSRRAGAHAVTDRLLTAREVAGHLGVATETVLRWHRSGRLPGGYRLATGVLRSRPGRDRPLARGTP